jgi:hypothetical protein
VGHPPSLPAPPPLLPFGHFPKPTHTIILESFGTKKCCKTIIKKWDDVHEMLIKKHKTSDS